MKSIKPKLPKKDIMTVCFDCGKEYGTPPKYAIGTWMDECDICGERKACASACHDFNICPTPDKRVLCYFCKTPIKLDEVGGVFSKDGKDQWFHDCITCIMAYVLYQEQETKLSCPKHNRILIGKSKCVDCEQELTPLNAIISKLASKSEELINTTPKQELTPKRQEEWEKIRLVRVEIYAPGSDYGLSDAISPWNDCNRAVNHLFRVDDINRANKNETIEIMVRKVDINKLNHS